MVTGYRKNQSWHILVIEDNPMLEKALVHSLENFGVNVFTTETPEDAVREIKLRLPSLVICDIEDANHPMEIFDTIKKQSQTDLIILYSGRVSDQLRTKLRPKEVIYKPFDTRFVCRRVLDLLSQNQSRKETNAVNINK